MSQTMKRSGWIAACGVAMALALSITGCGGGGGGGGGSSVAPPPPPPPPPTPPVITGPAAALTQATAGSAAAGATITATGTAPITFTLSSGSLPAGMTLNASTGAIAGTPLVSGSFAFTVTATNAGGSVTAAFTQVVASVTPNANLLLDGNRLVTLSTLVPTDYPAPTDITGLTSGETLVAIARRPNNGFLYGLAVTPMGEGRLYALHPATGFARTLGLLDSFVAADGGTPRPITGTRFGMHVSPSSDVLRIATDTGLNFRFDLMRARAVDGDPGVPGTQMDANLNGATNRIDALSYTDSRLGATVSTLYTVDSAIDSLCIQSPDSGGVQTSCLPLSAGVDAVAGLDIPPSVGVTLNNNPVTVGSATAIFQLAGETTQRIGQIDLTNGAISASRPAIGAGGIRSFALQAPSGIPMYTLHANASQLLAFNSANPGSVLAITLTGIAAGEQMVGVDFRPATGHLYGLGINATANTGTLYLIDLLTGACTALNPNAIAFDNGLGVAVDLPPSSTGYGFDFNPASDRIRVTTGLGLNFRINPAFGAPVDADGVLAGVQVDPALAPAGGTVAAIAYTNGSDVGGSVTTLYAVRSAGDQLCLLAETTGAMSSCGDIPLGLTLQTLGTLTGFDIPGGVRAPSLEAPVGAGVGYIAASLVGGDTHLFEIDLVTRAVVDRGLIGDGTIEIYGLAIGLATAR